MDMSLSKPLELVMDTEAQRPAGHGVPKIQTRLSHLTELNIQSFLQVFWLPEFLSCAKLSDDSVLKSWVRSEEHTSELQSPKDLVCRLLLEKKKNIKINNFFFIYFVFFQFFSFNYLYF